MLLMLNIGLAEIVILLLVLFLIFIIPFLGYKVGKVRTIGGGLGLLLSLFLSILGLLIVYSFPKTDSLVVSNIPEQLQKYKELLDSGAITEAEYQLQKDRLLK
jgi:branched-subunit amino acid transport protein AzlD